MSRDLADKYRTQTNNILSQYPDSEPMPAGEWTKEFAVHIYTSLKGRARYMLADVRALKDVVFNV